MFKKISVFTLVLFLCSNALYAKKTKDQLLKAGDNKQIGEAIAVEFDDRDLGFVTQISTMEMVLKNAYGQENRRKMESRTFERQDRNVGDKSMIIFHTPRDVNGTALLSFANILEADSQWLYLPSLKRVKRISSKNKSGPFVGSEFAFEDITGNEIGKYSWEFDKIEACPSVKSLQCFKLVTVPKYKHSGYTKRIVWVDVVEFRGMQVDYYDRKSTLMKTQTFNDYNQYLGKYWRAGNWKMMNHQNSKSTELFFKDYQFKTGLSEKDFTVATLKRIR